MANARKLKDDASAAANRGNWKLAAELYGKLEVLEDDGIWPLNLGQSLRRLGDNAAAVQALSRAVETYAKKDLLLKAIAVCKIILQIAPDHTRTQQRLALFHSARMADPAHSSDKEEVPPTPAIPARGSVPPVEPALPARDLVAAAWAPSSHLRTLAPCVRPTLSLGRQVDFTETRAIPGQPFVTFDEEPPPPLVKTLCLAELVPEARAFSHGEAPDQCHATEIPLEANLDLSPSSVPIEISESQSVAHMVLPKTPFLHVLSEKQLRMVIDRVQLVQLDTDEILFASGDPADALYVVAAGEIAVLVPQEVTRVHEGEFFGEIALLTNQPRTTTTRATMPSQVLSLGRALVHDLVAESPELLKVLLRYLRERLISILVKTSPMLAPFSDEERLSLTRKFHFFEVARDSQLIQQGEETCGLFILLAGEAVLSRNGNPVAHLTSGDVFGEISLVSLGPADTTVTTLEKSFVLCLPRRDLSEMIMTHPQVLEYLTTLAFTHASVSLDLG